MPAVVGSWPQPFLDGYDGERRPVAVECAGGGEACATVRGGAARAPGSSLAAGAPEGAIRVLVGPWARLRGDPAAALIEDGPQASGVFADFERRRADAVTRLCARASTNPAARRRATSAPTPAWSPRPGATTRRRSGS